MVELTGMMGEEAQEVLNDLHIGIDANKKIITKTHDFEIKLLAIDMLIMHIEFNYMEHEDLNEFFKEISDKIIELREELDILEKGEIHVILEQKSAEKMGTGWILKHRKKVEDEIKKETDIEKKILQKIHQTFKILKEKFSQVDHLFSVDIENATVKETRLELEEAEEEIKHILEKLMGFFVTYNKIFRMELERLGK
ncbi:hypothetical protein HN652_01075 [archaeon]|jgi:hypothetical protein|nr:hypothetical protein [archaeon]MBT6868916.1 hypothetical protein [archaeon]MBT7192863.1 hypothetical protein [archaeon]MBT7380829.1 hypothetical protein [archaeon]MBT7507584.1 hypothetical protein [archaeon]